MEGRTHAWLGLVARLLTGGVWIVAGALKVTNPVGSIEAVRAYDLLPWSVVEPLGYALPAIEIVVGVALVVGVFTRGAAVVSALLFIAFIIGIASVWARGIEIDCGCFGGGGPGDGVSWWDIARDVPVVIAGAYLAARPRGQFQLDNLFLDVEVDDGDDGRTDEGVQTRTTAGVR
jgi:uncharacterized membrane protein YphA (DoxX/SURF4 family)